MFLCNDRSYDINNRSNILLFIIFSTCDNEIRTDNIKDKYKLDVNPEHFSQDVKVSNLVINCNDFKLGRGEENYSQCILILGKTSHGMRKIIIYREKPNTTANIALRARPLDPLR